MAKEKTIKVEEPKVEKTENKTKDNVTKVNLKSKAKKLKESITKVDLSKPPPVKDEKVEQQPVEEEVVVVNADPVDDKVEDKTETPTIQEVTQEDIANVTQEIEEAVTETQQTGKPLPEKIEKLMSFMEETGGDLKDYVELNRDISKMDNSDILDEYYRTTKSHLSPEERSFLLQDSFGYDEEEDDPKEIKKKKIALKEQVAEAKAHLDRQKSKYYEEIKAGSRLTDEQREAISFFDAYNKQSEEQKKMSDNV